jgi:hypothetical protein
VEQSLVDHVGRGEWFDLTADREVDPGKGRGEDLDVAISVLAAGVVASLRSSAPVRRGARTGRSPAARQSSG